MRALWIAFGGYTLAWGLWLLSPFWDVFSTRAGLYDQMADFMPEWAWGLQAVLIGISIVYGALLRWPRGLMWGHVAGTYHWALIGLFYALGDWHNTGMLTCIALVILLHLMWKESKRQSFVIC